MVITAHAIKPSPRLLNQKISQKPVPDLVKFQHGWKVHLHYYHLQLECYPLHVYFAINDKGGKKIEIHGMNLGKMKNMKLK